MLLSLCQYINHSEFYDFLSYNSSVLGGLSDFKIRCIAFGIIEKLKFGRGTFLLSYPLGIYTDWRDQFFGTRPRPRN